MNELVRQFVMAAILEWRDLIERAMRQSRPDEPDWDEMVDDELACNRALTQLRYGWVDQSKVWG